MSHENTFLPAAIESLQHAEALVVVASQEPEMKEMSPMVSWPLCGVLGVTAVYLAVKGNKYKR